MTLRPYQAEAVEAVYCHLRNRQDSPCVVIPTGAGKTHIIAKICADAVAYGARAMVVAHVRELLEQARDKLVASDPAIAEHVGVYSAGLNRRDTKHRIIIGGIQSVYKRAFDFEPQDLLIVDEAHLIPPDGDGMYRQFIADLRKMNPALRVIGLTATPYRLSTGPICAPDAILNHVCYEARIADLIRDGYLSPVRSKSCDVAGDMEGVSVRGGEWVASELEAHMDTEERVRLACVDLVERTKDRRSVLVFCAGVGHAEHVAKQLKSMVASGVETITGETGSLFRSDTINAFRRGELKFLVNVNVLTTGFDAPNVDCVAMLRPTMSPGLYYQMVGRGLRRCEGKTDCMVLDYGGNVLRHGPIDAIEPLARKNGGRKGVAPQKTCPGCNELLPAAARQCTDCGYEFVEDLTPKHTTKAYTGAVLSTESQPKERAIVLAVTYSEHTKRGAPPGHPKTLRVDYQTESHGTVSEWVCVEHDGYALRKAAKWWSERSTVPMPRKASVAAAMAPEVLAKPVWVFVTRRPGSKYPEVAFAEFDDDEPYVPCRECGEERWVASGDTIVCGSCGHRQWGPPGDEPVEPESLPTVDDDDIPF